VWPVLGLAAGPGVAAAELGDYLMIGVRSV
jgi:hypothetical protein